MAEGKKEFLVVSVADAVDVTHRAPYIPAAPYLEDSLSSSFYGFFVHNKIFSFYLKKKVWFHRQVSVEEADAKARDLNVMFIETSAKAGFNVKALFRIISAALPGMETLSSTKQEDMVDVNLRSTGGGASQSQTESGCAC